MRTRSVLVLGALICTALAGCSSPSGLSPVEPATAEQSLAAAKKAFAADPSSAQRRLDYGTAQYQAHDDPGARRTLEPLLADNGDLGAQANLFAGAAAQRMGNLSDARVEYLRYLSIVKHDHDVEARLGDISRQEAVLAAQTAIKEERALNPATFSRSAVGVSPLTVASNDSSLIPLGYGLADLLIADLSVSPDLQIVDRVRVDAVLHELDLAKSGRTDSLTSPQLGRLVGARRLVNGVITPLPKSTLSMDARVTSVEEGAAAGRPVVQQTSLSDILDAEKQLALKLFAELGVTLTPKEREAVERRPTRYLSAFLAYARGSAAEAQWNLEAAEAYYTAALSIDPGFVLAQNRLASVRSNTGRPRSGSLNLPVVPDNWIQNILGGVAQGVNPSPGDVLGAPGNTTNSQLGGVLSAATTGTIVIIIGTP